MILDVALVRRRRRELQMSKRQVADQLGVTVMTVSRLEKGENHEALSLALVSNLAGVLSVDLGRLCRSAPAPVPRRSDQLAAAAGELLAHMTALTPVDALAESLDVTVDELEEALAVLAVRLEAVGMCLHRLNRTVAVRPAGKASPDHVKAMARKRLARSGMNITEARILARALAGTLDEGKLGNADQVALGRLRNAGIIEEDSGHVTGDVAVTFSVRWGGGIDGVPPARSGASLGAAASVPPETHCGLRLERTDLLVHGFRRLGAPPVGDHVRRTSDRW